MQATVWWRTVWGSGIELCNLLPWLFSWLIAVCEGISTKSSGLTSAAAWYNVSMRFYVLSTRMQKTVGTHDPSVHNVTECLTFVVMLWHTGHLRAVWLGFRVRSQLALWWQPHRPCIISPTGGSICPSPKRGLLNKEENGRQLVFLIPLFHEGVIQGWSSAQNMALTV